MKIFTLALIAFCCQQTLPAASVSLAWDANTEPWVTGYKVYWGTNSGAYTSTNFIRPYGGVLLFSTNYNGTNLQYYVPAGNLPTANTVSNLTSGVKYFFTVTAFTTDNTSNTPSLESGPSNEINYTAPSTPPPLQVQSPALSFEPSTKQLVLSWLANPTTDSVTNYVVYEVVTSALVKFASTTTTSIRFYPIAGLHVFTVTAQSAYGESPPSSAVDYTGILKPSNLIVVDASPTSSTRLVPMR